MAIEGLKHLIIIPRIPGSGNHTGLSAASRLTMPNVRTRMKYHNGPLLEKVALTAIFWSNLWETDAKLTSIRNDHVQFMGNYVKGDTIRSLKEYSTNGFTIGTGELLGAPVVPIDLAPAHSVTTEVLFQKVSDLIDSHHPPTKDLLFLIFMPPNIEVISDGLSSCHGLGGYHSQTRGKIPFGVIPFPCAIPGPHHFTLVTSHEICEAITDPFEALIDGRLQGSGWRDPDKPSIEDEIADVCSESEQMKMKLEDGQVVTTVYLNSVGFCK